MQFVFSREQDELRDAMSRMLAERAPITRNRELAEAGERYDPVFYRDMAEQVGLVGIALPEELGGSGGSIVDLAVVCEEQGAVLLGGPFFATAVLAAQALIVHPEDPLGRELAGSIAGGKSTGALAILEADGRWDAAALTTRAERTADGHTLTGTKDLVLDGSDADELLVAARGAAGVSLFRVPAGAEGVRRDALEVLDPTRALARVHFDRAPAQLIGPEGGGDRVMRHVHRVGTVMLAAEQVGGARRCVEMTAQHARQRSQFGRRVGAFQAVKHRLADMAARLELADAAVYWAAWQCGQLADCGGDRVAQADDEAIAVAGSYCGESFVRTAADTIQLHGGLGFTWEHDAHLFLRRARADVSLLGTPHQHRERLAELIAPEGASHDW